MTDTLTPEQRKRCMSRVKGKDTKPEVKLRKALWRKGLRYRLGYKLPGKPDIVFVSARIVVFVDGCFWHGCPIHGSIPETNRMFWEKKISKNIQRDLEVTVELQNNGWTVIRVWTHELKEEFDSVVNEITRVVNEKSEMEL